MCQNGGPRACAWTTTAYIGSFRKMSGHGEGCNKMRMAASGFLLIIKLILFGTSRLIKKKKPTPETKGTFERLEYKKKLLFLGEKNVVVYLPFLIGNLNAVQNK